MNEQKKQTANSKSSTRSRPAIFRALGNNEPPPVIEVRGKSYQRVEIFKHDSWAATAVYRHGQNQIVCKFNRQQRIGPVPMRWLGRALARRESYLLQRLKEIDNVPAFSGSVRVNGQVLRNAAAHAFIPGHPLGLQEQVDDEFFPALEIALNQIHRCGVAYVDLHKRENILVGEDGKPYLIDFQVGFWQPHTKFFRFVTQGLLRRLQQSDQYHLAKHIQTCRPDQSRNNVDQLRPFMIKVHRFFAVPLRTVRRKLLVALGIRTASGHASTELNPEVGHRAA